MDARHLQHPVTPRERSRAQFLMVLVTAAVFGASLLPALAPTPVGVLYTIPILLAPWAGRLRLVRRWAWLCTGLSLLVFAMPWISGTASDVAPQIRSVNACLVLFALWVSASLSLYRIESEQEVRRGRRLLAATLSSIGDAVVATNELGILTFMNGAAEELTGWTQEEAEGRPVESVLDLSGGDYPTRDSVACEGPLSGRSRPKLLRSRQGEARQIDVLRTPVRNPAEDEGGTHRDRGEVWILRDVAERVKYEHKIKRLAYRDPMTALPNRTSMWDRLGLEMSHAKRDDTQLGFLFLDLNGFKQVNDTLGHQAGDDLLRGVAQRLRETLRDGDTVARIGGDEFVVLLPGLHGFDDARGVAEKIIEALRKPIPLGDTERVSLPSIGIALFPRDATDGDDLMHIADQAMYRAKQAGNGCWFDAAELGGPGTCEARAGESAHAPKVDTSPSGARGAADLQSKGASTEPEGLFPHASDREPTLPFPKD